MRVHPYVARLRSAIAKCTARLSRPTLQQLPLSATKCVVACARCISAALECTPSLLPPLRIIDSAPAAPTVRYLAPPGGPWHRASPQSQNTFSSFIPRCRSSIFNTKQVPRLPFCPVNARTWAHPPFIFVGLTEQKRSHAPPYSCKVGARLHHSTSDILIYDYFNSPPSRATFGRRPPRITPDDYVPRLPSDMLSLRASLSCSLACGYSAPPAAQKKRFSRHT